MTDAATNNARPPHLALVTANPLRTGGMQRFTRFLVETACGAGWQVTVALSGHDIYTDIATPDGNGPTVEHIDWVNDTLGGDRRYRWRVIADRQRWFRRTRPDVVLFVQSSNTPFRASIVGAKLAGVPIVTTHRTMPWIRDFVTTRRYLGGLVPGLGLHNRRQQFSTRLTAALAQHVIYNSENVRQAYEQVYRYPRNKGCVIRNAVQLAERELPGHASDAITVGYVGRLGNEKRIDVLIRAIAELRHRGRVQLEICGEGPERDALTALARELDVASHVAFCGETDDVESAYARCDIVALCSRRESSSNMVLEAMAAGKPVVVTDVGGLPELVGDDRGLLVPAGDVPALAAALDRLITDAALREQLGARARAYVEQHHERDMIEHQWLDLLTDTATRRTEQRERNLKSRPEWHEPRYRTCP